jgi:hypothetical protein
MTENDPEIQFCYDEDVAAIAVQLTDMHTRTHAQYGTKITKEDILKTWKFFYYKLMEGLDEEYEDDGTEPGDTEPNRERPEDYSTLKTLVGLYVRDNPGAATTEIVDYFDRDSWLILEILDELKEEEKVQ